VNEPGVLLDVATRFGFGVGFDLAQRVVDEFAVLSAGAILQHAGVNQGDENGSAGEHEANHPIQDESKVAQPIFEQGFTRDKHQRSGCEDYSAEPPSLCIGLCHGRNLALIVVKGNRRCMRINGD
jgi:hypothetical protein